MQRQDRSAACPAVSKPGGPVIRVVPMPQLAGNSTGMLSMPRAAKVGMEQTQRLGTLVCQGKRSFLYSSRCC